MKRRWPASTASKLDERGRGRTDAGILHVVLGTGPLGLALLRHLAAGGQRVRAVAGHGRDDLPAGVEFVGANLADVSEAERACDGADVVYDCANPPYAKWLELHPPSCKPSSMVRPLPARGSCSATTSTHTALRMDR